MHPRPEHWTLIKNIITQKFDVNQRLLVSCVKQRTDHRLIGSHLFRGHVLRSETNLSSVWMYPNWNNALASSGYHYQVTKSKRTYLSKACFASFVTLPRSNPSLNFDLCNNKYFSSMNLSSNISSQYISIGGSMAEWSKDWARSQRALVQVPRLPTYD